MKKDADNNVVCSGDVMKKTAKNEMKNLQECLKILYNNICVFLRAIELLTNENEISLCDSVQRHLIRTLCTEICDLLIHEIEKRFKCKIIIE